MKQVTYFPQSPREYIAVETDAQLSTADIEQLCWLFASGKPVNAPKAGVYVGPRTEMITPWSTNVTEIIRYMGINGVTRAERFVKSTANAQIDRMLYRLYRNPDAEIFANSLTAAPIVHIDDIRSYNVTEGLALSNDEIEYLEGLSKKLGRPLTDSEVFGFSQVNSEHCRHKIFNGTFIIDGEEKDLSLFKLIKLTSQQNPNGLVSAYKDNVAFVEGPEIEQFYPQDPETSGLFATKRIPSVISLKAETHNFPTTVEPFNGAATGTGGEIRDRLGGGRASLPLAGTAVYMTSYPRLDAEQPWGKKVKARKWLYHAPADLLIKASNGASDFGNKFGQPLICGSLLTFEHEEKGRTLAYDKVIMLAGGVGFASKRDAIKGTPQAQEKVVVMGGDNYRIGMGGGAVSSVDTGSYGNAIELNAVQRANPEMQKRVANVIRALAESDENPIVSVHDHGAGGHLNALSELVEETGGHIDASALPVGDKTLSLKEIIGNESQERMGFVVKEQDIDRIRQIAERERAPMYVVGETTGDHRFVFEAADGSKPIDLAMADMFGNSPKTVITDHTVNHTYSNPKTSEKNIEEYLRNVLSLEAVACKDWLTNKVDRSVTGRVARQQCQGRIQLPLSDCGVVALDYTGTVGIATSIGHAPQTALADSAKGSVMAVAESLTNIVGANLKDGLKSVSLSANWMWPCKNEGEDAALYRAVEACSKFVCDLGINIPTGKDSLSMTQKYPNGKKVLAPGTVIISAAGEVTDVKKTIGPVMSEAISTLYYIDFSSDSLKLGGSALYQSLGHIGSEAPTVNDATKFASAFNAVQRMVADKKLLAMHDVSAGGLVTTLLEMTFANPGGGVFFHTTGFEMYGENDLVKILFSENPAVVIQVDDSEKEAVEAILDEAGVKYFPIGYPTDERTVMIDHAGHEYLLGIDWLRDVWYRPSYMLDSLQSGNRHASMRYANYKRQPLKVSIPKSYSGKVVTDTEAVKPRAAIIREKGVNSEREMAYWLYKAGFEVKDVHTSDLMSGRTDLSDVNLIVFCGGFSNSDVLGSAKGWAAMFHSNANARKALEDFYNREDTLSLGVCNGCQLMIELGLIHSKETAAEGKLKMGHNRSGKFESEFVGLSIPKNQSVMLRGLSGMKLGVWVAHGEGRFIFPTESKDWQVVARYNYAGYPGNPNGTPGAVAGVASVDGRHLAIMPHPERSVFPWQCAWYPEERKNDEVTPWFEMFTSARAWILSHTK